MSRGTHVPCCPCPKTTLQCSKYCVGFGRAKRIHHRSRSAQENASFHYRPGNLYTIYMNLPYGDAFRCSCQQNDGLQRLLFETRMSTPGLELIEFIARTKPWTNGGTPEVTALCIFSILLELDCFEYFISSGVLYLCVLLFIILHIISIHFTELFLLTYWQWHQVQTEPLIETL